MLGSWRRGLPGQATGYLALCLFSSILFLSHSVPLVKNFSSSASNATERPSDSLLVGAKLGNDANGTLLPRNTSPVLKVSIRTLSVHVPERLLLPKAAMNVKKKLGKRDPEGHAKRVTLPNQIAKVGKKPCSTDSKKRGSEKSTKISTPSAQPMKANSLSEKAKQPSPEVSKLPTSLHKEKAVNNTNSQVAAGLKSKMQASGNPVNANAQNATAIGIAENLTETASKKMVAVSITSLFEVGAWEQNMKPALPWKIRSAVRSFLGRIWRTAEKSSAGSRHSSDKIRISDGHEIAARVNEPSGVAVPVTKKEDRVPTLKVPRASVPVVHLSKPAAKKVKKPAVKRPAKLTVNRQIIQAAQTTQYVQSGQNPNVAEMATPSQPDIQQGQMAAVPSMASASTGFGQANNLAVQSESAQAQLQPPPSEESVASITEEVDETEADDEDYSSPAAALVEGDAEMSNSDAEVEAAPEAPEAVPDVIEGSGGTVAAASMAPISETSAIRGDNITQLSNMVYKVAKEEGVHRLVVAPCRTTLKWMPEVVRKLEYEIPGFKFYCVDTWEKGSPEDGGQELGSLTLADLSAAFAGCVSTEVLSMPISKIERLFPRDIDLVVSWMGMQVWGTRKAWRFIKGLRRSGTRLGLFGNDPRSKNAESDEKRRLNVRKSPMLFNEPLRVISRVGEDEEENPKQLLLYPMDGIRDGF